MTRVLLSLFAIVGMCSAFPSEHLEHIPVPGYNPKLQLLGQHVHLSEIPTKIIRITKTVAIKVPVPYPVKVPHSVPYPVHVSKPYPVPVPQIVKIPHPVPVPVPVHQQSGGGADSYNIQSQGHDLSGNSLGGGYGGSSYGGGSEHYEESQQVASPVAYPVMYQVSEGSNLQNGDLAHAAGTQITHSYHQVQHDYLPKQEVAGTEITQSYHQHQHDTSATQQDDGSSYQQGQAHQAMMRSSQGY